MVRKQKDNPQIEINNLKKTYFIKDSYLEYLKELLYLINKKTTQLKMGKIFGQTLQQRSFMKFQEEHEKMLNNIRHSKMQIKTIWYTTATIT